MDSKNKNLIARPPVVVVVGHIDHGKSTLLDYIRKTSTTEKEAGGITQHISAYEAKLEISGQKRKITFLDTPGHEAFCSIRERGTRIADVAILVVSAEDGVKPQTVEALNCITKDSTPFIVALNKIDRPNADINKVKTDLAENGVLVEGWGGSVPIVPLSAKTGEGVADLLEIIALQSDLEELTGDSSLMAEGFVVESNLNPKQGIAATLLIKNGAMKTGMFVASVGAFAPIRAIENYKGENIKEASFSSPVKIVGWSNTPMVGREFKTFHKKEEAQKFAGENNNSQTETNQEFTPEGQARLEIVLKTDALGSLDAVEHELKKLSSDKITVKIISKSIGSITEKDIKTASVKNSLILGFNVNTDKIAEMLAMRDKIEIKTFKIIYELIDFLKEKVKEATPIETVEIATGSAKILRVFSKNKDKQVVGGRLEEGEIKSGSLVKIYRREYQIGEGKIKELQAQKVKIDIVKEKQEFGMMLESKIELSEGDIIKATSLIKQE
ncbi:MAG: translation initiation factor IF-2 [Patescibacteria group bacterium]